MRRTPMLKQIDTLPGPQSELSLHDRNCKLDAGQDRADMRGHVVGALFGVPISAAFLWRNAIEERLEISANVRRGVLLDEQSGRGMPAK